MEKTITLDEIIEKELYNGNMKVIKFLNKSSRHIILNILKNTNIVIHMHHLNNIYKNDEEIVSKILTYDGAGIRYLSYKLQNNKNIILKAFSNINEIINIKKDTLINSFTLNDKDFIMKILEQNKYILYYVIGLFTPSISNDIDIARKIINLEIGYGLLGKKMQDNREIALLLLNNNIFNYEIVSDKIKEDKDLTIELVTIFGSLLKFCSKEFRDDFDVVSRAVKKNLYTPKVYCVYEDGLEYMLNSSSYEDEYIENKKIHLTDDSINRLDQYILWKSKSLETFSVPLKYASFRLRDNDKIFKMAMENNTKSYKYASIRLQIKMKFGL